VRAARRHGQARMFHSSRLQISGVQERQRTARARLWDGTKTGKSLMCTVPRAQMFTVRVQGPRLYAHSSR
jgi:hypothetical protein